MYMYLFLKYMYICTTLKRNRFDIRLNFLLIQFYKHFRDQIQEIHFTRSLQKASK